jgi:hypothetical protein
MRIKMNAPRIARFIRRSAINFSKLARPFTPESDSEKWMKNFLNDAYWMDKLECCSDRQMGLLVARIFSDESFGTEKSGVICEVMNRLSRSPLGSNRLDDAGRKIFGIALNVRLIPGIGCDGCHSIGYVCDKTRLCLYCLGLKVSVEERRQKLTGTLRGRFATIATEVREKLRKFNEPIN